MPGFGMVIQFIPRSPSFESLEGEFKEAARGISRTIADRYWKDLSRSRSRYGGAMVEE